MLSILGSLLGFASSTAPAIMDHFASKEDRKHEIERMKTMAEIKSQGIEMDMRVYEQMGADKEHERLIAHDTAIQQSTGWTSALQKSVRPVITYAFFGLFATIEITLLMEALDKGTDFHKLFNYCGTKIQKLSSQLSFRSGLVLERWKKQEVGQSNMPTKAQELETRVSLVEKDMSHMVTMFEKLDTSIEKIAEVHQDMREILTVHEQRINAQEITDKDIYNEIKELRRETSEQHKSLEKKIMDLEKYRWTILGALGIITFVLTEFDIIFK